MQNLSLLSKQELLNHTKNLAEEDQRISLLLVEALRECERRMLFAELGFSSLWEFAVRYLGLSEGSAQLRISAMRLARDNSQVMERLQSGALSLSNASQLYSFFQSEKKAGKTYTREVKQEMIQEMVGLSKKECERKLLARSPEVLPKEKERPVSETKTELKLVLNNDTMEKLHRLKDLLAHQLPEATHGEVIEHLIDETLERLERKKGGPKVDQTTANSPRPEIMTERLKEEAPKAQPRTYIPVADRHWVWNRAGGRCEYVSPEGIRCRSGYGLELDHCTPLALGGNSDRASLRFLCSNHNIQQAAHQLGYDLMEQYVWSLK